MEGEDIGDGGSDLVNRDAGIISRSVDQIFDHLRRYSSDYSVKVSHLELYNEELFDLLNPEPSDLELYETHQGLTVKGLHEVEVFQPSDIFKILSKSLFERKVAETESNAKSR